MFQSHFYDTNTNDLINEVEIGNSCPPIRLEDVTSLTSFTKTH
jgi:hypothetical protein